MDAIKRERLGQWGSWGLIVIGAIALFVGIGADLGSFLSGLLQGAGLAVTVGGGYFLGMMHGANQAIARGEEPGAWLPSRDKLQSRDSGQ